VEGFLTAKYDNYMAAPGNAGISFQYKGIPDESEIRTSLGGSLKIDETLLVDMPWPIPDVNVVGTLIQTAVGIQGDTDFTYGTNVQKKGSVQYTPTIGSLGVDIVVAGIAAEIKVNQNNYLTAGAVKGSLAYTHLGTGTSGVAPFAAEDTNVIHTSVPLNLPGYWALTPTDLSLYSNSFYTDIGMGIEVNIWATLFGKAGIGGGFDVYENTPFTLDFDEVEKLGTFLIYVAEPGPNSVPEPGTAFLLGSALLSLVGVRRIRG
jgi:hypothetical protein